MSLPSSIDNPRVVYIRGWGRPVEGTLFDVLDYFFNQSSRDDQGGELENLRSRVDLLQELVLALLVMHHSGQHHRLLLPHYLTLFSQGYSGASLTHEEEPR